MTMIYDFKQRPYLLMGANQQCTELECCKTKAKIIIANHHFKRPMWQVNGGNDETAGSI